MNSHYTLEAAFHYAADEGDPALADWLDDVMVHLESIGAEDVMMVSDNEDSSFVVSLLVGSQSGDLPENIVGKGMSTLRTAFHACDATTAGWPSPREALMIYVNVTMAEDTETAETLVPA